MAGEDGPSASECEPTQGGQNVETKKMPGRQPGAKGFVRTQKFAVTGEQMHRATACTACGDVLPGDAPAQAYAAWDGIDIEVSPEGGLRLNCTRHTLRKRSLPLPFSGGATIVAAILAGGTPALSGGVNAYSLCGANGGFNRMV
jgi:hypothetical protein